MNSPAVTKPFDPPPPEGYRAVEHGVNCRKCAFYAFGEVAAKLCATNPCIPDDRADGRFVVFVKVQA